MPTPGRVITLVLVAPLLVATPFVVSFAGLALVGPVADLASASIDVVDDAGAATAAGVVLGFATIAAVAVAMALSGEAATEGTARDLLGALALGVVLTPLLLVAVAPRFEDDIDVGDPAGRFIVEVSQADTELVRGAGIGALVAVVAACALQRTGRLAGLPALLRRRVIDAFTDDRPPPDYR